MATAAYTINQFDSKNMDFAEWAEDFISLVKITNCPNANLKHLLRLYLDAPAKRALNSLADGVTTNIDTLIANMKKELTPPFVAEEAQDVLEHLKRGNQEIEQFGYLVKKTVSRAYPSLNAVEADQMARKCFTRGLGGELKKRLEICSPNNLDATIKCALQQDRFLTVDYSENRENDLKKEMSKIQYELKILQRQQDYSSPGSTSGNTVSTTSTSSNKGAEKSDKGNFGPIRCQLCSTIGHSAMTCRKSPVNIPAAGKLYDPNKDPSTGVNHLSSKTFIEETFFIDEVPCKMLIDSGSAVTILPYKWIIKHPTLYQQKIPAQGKQLTTANGSRLKIQWKLPNMPILYKDAQSNIDILIAEDLEPNHCGIIGIDTLKSLGINISFADCNVSTNIEKSNLLDSCTKQEKLENTATDGQEFYATRNISIAPNVQTVIEVEFSENMGSQDLIFEHKELKNYPFLKLGNSLINPSQGKVFIPCLNMANEETVISKNTVLGQLFHVDYEEGPDTYSPRKEQEDQPLQSDFKFDLDHLSYDQHFLMRKLLSDNLDVFSAGSHDLGRTHMLEHEIDVQGNTPIRQYPRRKSPEARKIEDKLIEQMLQDKIIRPSNSPWASPILLTKKKDGSYRFCIDFRKVNMITKKDSYPLCNINEALETLKGATWFTSLDLMSGFWQVPIKESHKEVTAFTTGRKLYEFEVLPFGMCNSPSTFSRLMERVLDGLQWDICLIYVDDILIFAKTFDELLKRMQLIFNRLRQAELKLKPSKCSFAHREIKYLGHVINEKGIAVDPKKIEAIEKMKTPQNPKEVRSFLGLTGYYRRFVKDYAKIASPLTNLTHQDVTYDWTSDCEKAFNQLKTKLMSAPILLYPDFEKAFTLMTDASGVGLGAVLSQQGPDGLEHPVAYASRTLNETEKNYSTSKKECLALIWAVHTFHPYVYGNKEFTIITDHHSLTWLDQNKATNCLLARWAMILEGYNYKIKYRPGNKLGNADGLSRLSLENETREPWHSNAELEFVIGMQEREEDIIKGWIQGRNKLPNELIELEKQEVRVENDCIFVNNKQYVPLSRVHRVASRLHDHPLGAAHFGYKKTYDKFCHYFFALNASSVIKEICENCSVCPVMKHENKTARTSMGTVKTTHRWEILSVDISGPFPLSDRQNKYLLTIVDLFSKYTILVPIQNIKAKTVALAILSHAIAYFGVPVQILSDRGPQFESLLLQELCDVLGINKLRTTSYHPQSNAVNERSHQTVNRLIRTFIEGGYNHQWDTIVPVIMLAINSNINTSTQYMPYEALMGTQPQLPEDLLYGRLPETDRTLTEEIQNLQFQLAEIGDQIIDNTSKAYLAQAKQYNKKGRHTWYFEGDLVYMKYRPTAGEVGKLAPHWKGPYEVVNSKNFPVIEINIDGKYATVHHDNLKKCKLTREQLYFRHDVPNGSYFLKKKNKPPVSWAENDDNEETEMFIDADDSLDEINVEVDHGRSPVALQHYDLRPRPMPRVLN